MRLFAPLTPIALAAGLALALPAQAAVLGGASLELSGDYVLTEIGADLGVAISGSFFAQSLIDDFTAVEPYALSLLVTLDGTDFLDTTVPLGLVSIDDVLADPRVAGALAGLAPAFGATSGSLSLLGQSYDFSYTVTSSDPDSIGGLFTLSTLLTGTALIDLAPLGTTGTFALSAAIAPVPLPASLPLLLAGLGLTAWVARRRAQSAR